MVFCTFDHSQGWNRSGTGISHERFCDFTSGGRDMQEHMRKEGMSRNGTDVKKARVKIDDMNVSSSECPFESLYHTIPSVHA